MPNGFEALRAEIERRKTPQTPQFSALRARIQAQQPEAPPTPIPSEVPPPPVRTTPVGRIAGGVQRLAEATRETIEPARTTEQAKRLFAPVAGQFGVSQPLQEVGEKLGAIRQAAIERIPETKIAQRFPKLVAAVTTAAEILAPGELTPSGLQIELGGVAAFGLGGRAFGALRRAIKGRPTASFAALEASVAPEAPGVFQQLKSQLLRSGEPTFRRQGKAGISLADDFRNLQAQTEIRAGTAKDKFMDDLVALNDIEKDAFVEFLDKGIIQKNLTPKARSVVMRAKGVLTNQGQILEQLSKETGFKVTTPQGKRPFFARKNFFPREPDFDRLATTEGRADEVKHLLDPRQPQASSPEEANRIIDLILQRQSPILDDAAIRGVGQTFRGVATELKRARIFDLKNFIRDPVRALSRNIDRTSESIERIKIFGPSNEKYIQRLSEIRATGGDFESAKTLGNRLLGLEEKNFGLSRALSEIRGFQALKLGLAVIKNIPQGFVNSWLESGSVRVAAKGFFSQFTKEGVRFAKSSGAAGNKLVDDYLDAVVGIVQNRPGLFQKLGGKLLDITKFKSAEIANRVVAANAGREYAQSILVPRILKNPLDKLARKEFKNLGVNAEKIIKNRGVDQQDLLRISNEFSRLTQFKADPLSLPIFWTTPWGRVLTQFKSFSFNQGKLIARNMAKRPITTPIRLAAVATAVGIPVNTLDSVLRARFKKNQEKMDSFIDEALAGLMTIGGLGLFSDIFESAKFGKQGSFGFFLGPTGSDIANLAFATRQAVLGKPKALAREAVKKIPVAGPALKNILFPPKQKRK